MLEMLSEVLIIKTFSYPDHDGLVLENLLIKQMGQIVIKDFTRIITIWTNTIKVHTVFYDFLYQM